MKLYFKGLDTLRAIAAIVVVISHIELIKSNLNIPALLNINLPDAHLAVILFFILSGFLITFLLLKEKENTETISFRKFYTRRILRIWPVYYLVIFSSLIIFDTQYSIKTIALCLGIFPNIAHALNIGWTTSPQIWSIGVEEQFYLFWPLIIYIIPSKKLISYLLVFTIAHTLLPHCIKYINDLSYKNESLNDFANRFFYLSKFNSMSIGGIFGCLFALKRKALSFFYKRIVAYPAIVLSFLLWFSGFSTSNFNDIMYSLLFAIMILNVSTNKNLKFSLESKVFNFLGKISYGMYMYHWIILLLIIKTLPYSFFNSNSTYNIALYSIGLSTTILISYVSFISFEKYFLRIKEKY